MGITYLIQLAKNMDVQSKPRAELLAFGADPTHDQLATNLSCLDAVVYESLRMHLPIPDATCMVGSRNHDLYGVPT